jgi:hypothetical protein
MVIKDRVTNKTMREQEFSQYVNKSLGHEVSIEGGEVIFFPEVSTTTLPKYLEQLNQEYGYELECY